VAIVVYAGEALGTYFKDVRLKVYKRNPAERMKGFPDSLTITRGAWGTRPDYLHMQVLRVFDMGGERLVIEQADEHSYQEIERVLRAIRRGWVIWQTGRLSPERLHLSKIRGIGPGHLPGSYRIVQSGTGVAMLGQMEGTQLVVKDVEMLPIP